MQGLSMLAAGDDKLHLLLKPTFRQVCLGFERNQIFQGWGEHEDVTEQAMGWHHRRVKLERA